MIVLGIDGGGTSTRALLADGTGTVLGTGRSRGSNPNNLPRETCRAHLAEAFAGACAAAGHRGPVDHVFMGAAGIKDDTDALVMQELVAESLGLPSERIRVANDLLNSLAGGLAGRPGIALIAGTGSHCLGRNSRGETATCGGWGWLMCDVGSGHFLGQRALQAVVRAADGRGPATSLSVAVLNELGIDAPSALLRRVYDPSVGPAGIAALARLVLDAAREDDAVARDILREGADGLALLVQRVGQRLFSGASPGVVLTGGVALSGEPYQPLITQSIQGLLPGARVQPPELPPEAGAVLNALGLAGIAPEPAVLQKLKTTLAL